MVGVAPFIKEGSEFIIDVDVVIVALGTTPNPLIAQTTKGLETAKRGTVVVDEATGRTVKLKVWAGGDIVTGAATVISAMGAAKRAAASIDEYLRGYNHRKDRKPMFKTVLEKV